VASIERLDGSIFQPSGERQTHAPITGHILATVPWIQETLDRLGIAANTPGELTHLFRTNAELAALGYAIRCTYTDAGQEFVLVITCDRALVVRLARMEGGSTASKY
jgi:hypothetical protein